MNPLQLLRQALRALARNKLRSGLSTLGIIISVAAVVAMQAVGAGASERMRQQWASLGSNRLVVFPGSSRSMGARHVGAGVTSTLTEADGEAIGELRGVQAVAPLLRVNAQIVAGNQNWPSNVTGTTLAYFDIQAWGVRAGALWDAAAEARGAKQCLIDQTVADQLFAGADPLGSIIRIGQTPCDVIGVLEVKGQGSWGQDQDDVVLAPLNAVRMRLSGQSAARARTVDQLLVTAFRPEDTARLEREVSGLLRQRHRIAPGGEDDFGVRNLSEIARAAQATAATLQTLLLVIALISLIVGGIGIMNIMLVSVTERTREIGIRLAVGATPRDILFQFLVETIVLTALGGTTGVALGVLAARAMRSFAGWQTQIDPAVVLVAVLFSGLVGVIFGLLPSVRAARLDPIEALRHE